MQDLKTLTDLLDAVKRANNELEIVTIGTKQDKNGNHRLRLRARSREISFEKYTFPLTKQGLKATIKIAHEIETDFFRGCFDPSLIKYGLAKKSDPKLTEITTLPINNEPDLKEIWENYKALKPDTPKSTIRAKWQPIDKWLSKCPKECLNLANADKLLAWLRSQNLSDGYLEPSLRTLRSAVNLSIKLGKTKASNTIAALIPLLEIDDRNIQIYTKTEAKMILAAFKSGRYDNDASAYSSTYYADFVEFRIRTGCRPSEAIALTWEDIKINGDKMQIIFNKRYVTGQLQQGTKNGISARIFPCNKGMIDFINNLPKIPNDKNLVFPSYMGLYLDLANFNRRYWQPIVRSLALSKAISKELNFYDLRHSFITWLVRDGIDIKTIATICGNSPETIMKFYLASNDSIELPEI